MKSEMPIRRKSNVQTGPKTHADGVKEDLIKVEYQEVTAGIVNIDPIHPAICGMARDTTSFHQSDFFIRKV
jgi:hypothetical protein